MEKFLWVITIIGCVIGGGFIALALVGESSAPQQGAAAAVGIGFAAIPYCLARAVAELNRAPQKAEPEPTETPNKPGS